MILPGSSALAAWGVGCGAESPRSQPKHCLWCSGTQRGPMCSWRPRGVARASLVRPGAVTQPRPGPSSAAHAFPVVSSSTCCPPSWRQPPAGEQNMAGGLKGYGLRGAARGAASPEGLGRGCTQPAMAVWGRQGNGLSSGRGSGPGFECSPPQGPSRAGEDLGEAAVFGSAPGGGLQGLSLGCEPRPRELSLRISASPRCSAVVPSHGATH